MDIKINFLLFSILLGWAALCLGQQTGTSGFACNPLEPACNRKLSAKYGCNILDPRCRQRIDAHNNKENVRPSFQKKASGGCVYPNFWLIPGKADTSCTRRGVPNVLNIRTRDVEIQPKVIKLPGCFTIKISGTVLESSRNLPNSYLGKTSYQWWNLKEFESLKCQNASNNGCGGFGNNCNYCDICQSLQDLSNNKERDQWDISRTQQDLIDQFKGLNCPKGPGDFTIVKEFCFNDWKAFDEDGDCKFDFLKGEDLDQYIKAFKSLEQIGFGTLVAKFKLAHNATEPQIFKRKHKEAQIDIMVRNELSKRRTNWDDVSNGDFDTFQDWYIQTRKDHWHKNRYLPWLLYTNEVACLKVTFDVCDQPPVPAKFGRFDGPSMQCP